LALAPDGGRSFSKESWFPGCSACNRWRFFRQPATLGLRFFQPDGRHGLLSTAIVVEDVSSLEEANTSMFREADPFDGGFLVGGTDPRVAENPTGGKFWGFAASDGGSSAGQRRAYYGLRPADATRFFYNRLQRVVRHERTAGRTLVGAAQAVWTRKTSDSWPGINKNSRQP